MSYTDGAVDGALCRRWCCEEDVATTVAGIGSLVAKETGGLLDDVAYADTTVAEDLPCDATDAFVHRLPLDPPTPMFDSIDRVLPSLRI